MEANLLQMVAATFLQYNISGKPDVNEQLKNAKYTIKFHKDTLDIIVKTSKLGRLEISLLLDQNEEYHTDKIVYYNTQDDKYSVYDSSAPKLVNKEDT